jgi:hypothetical protein
LMTMSQEPWSIWYKGTKLTKNIGTAIYDIVHAPEAKDCWAKKDDWIKDNSDEVHWEAIHTSASETSLSKQIFITKHASGMCGVGRFMCHWKQRDTDPCPRCGMAEDTLHIWRCSGCNSDIVWNAAIENLTVWMDSVDTDPELCSGILHYLNSWRHDSSLQQLTSNEFLELFHAQGDIGWNHFFSDGYIGGFSQSQKNHYNGPFLLSKNFGMLHGTFGNIEMRYYIVNKMSSLMSPQLCYKGR